MTGIPARLRENHQLSAFGPLRASHSRKLDLLMLSRGRDKPHCRVHFFPAPSCSPTDTPAGLSVASILQSSPQSLFSSSKFPHPSSPSAFLGLNWGFSGLSLLFELKQTVPRSLSWIDRCILWQKGELGAGEQGHPAAPKST